MDSNELKNEPQAKKTKKEESGNRKNANENSTKTKKRDRNKNQKRVDLAGREDNKDGKSLRKNKK